MDNALIEVCRGTKALVGDYFDEKSHLADHQAARRQLAPQGILRAGINLSNFLLVTGKDEQVTRIGIFIWDQQSSLGIIISIIIKAIL